MKTDTVSDHAGAERSGRSRGTSVAIETQPAPLPANEAQRLAVLRQYGVLDTEEEAAFGNLVRLAATVCEAPIALVSFVDERRQWFKARVGLEVSETPRDIAFCAHAILQSEPLVVPDALADERFASNPLVRSDPHIRFYAGIPLEVEPDVRLGTLCVIDRKPHALLPVQLQTLQVLRDHVTTLLHLRRTSLDLQSTVSRSHAAAQRQDALLDNSSDIITIVGADGTFRYVSPAVRRILGYDPTDLLGRDGFALVHPDDASSLLALFASRLDPRSDEQVAEYRVRRADGSWVWVESVGRNLLEDPSVRGFVSNTREITERKELERRQADWIAMITHDIRNPVGIIGGYLDMLRDQKELSAESRDLVRLMGDTAQTVLSLATSYLDLSRIENRALAVNRTPLGLDVVVAKVAERYRMEAARRNVDLELQLASAVPKIEGDELIVQRILENLLHNALKFTPDGGRVILAVEARTDCVACSLSDNGPGIAAEELGNLFQRYGQTDAGRARRGAGLGLYIAKSLVEAHGGTVDVTSTVGAGTRFTVRFPLSAAGPQP